MDEVGCVTKWLWIAETQTHLSTHTIQGGRFRRESQVALVTKGNLDKTKGGEITLNFERNITPDEPRRLTFVHFLTFHYSFPPTQ